MSREIKFRAKSLKTNEFVFGFFGQRTETSPVRETTQTYTINYILVDNGFCGFEEIEIDIKTLGQFTGLLDKNGKEIYEGDIVIIDNKHASLGSDIIKTVLFKNGMFGVSEDVYSFISLKEFFVGVESTKKYISNYGEIFEEYKAVVEVIGNIYENPELITEVKNG